MNQEQLKEEYCVEMVAEVVQDNEKADVPDFVIDTSCEPVKAYGGKKIGLKSLSLGFHKKRQEKFQPVLKEREPYSKTVELYSMVKMPRCNVTPEAKTLVRSLMERLKNESPFGYGDNAVIACENDIARCLEEIEQNIEGLFDLELAKEASDVIVINCRTIQAKLKVRTQLKRK